MNFKPAVLLLVFALALPEAPARALVSKEGGKPAARQAEKAAPAASAKQAEKEEIKIEAKTVRGKVTSVFQNRIAVEFVFEEEKGSEEILITLAKDTKLVGVKDVKQLAYGDEVKVDYELSYKMDKKNPAAEPLLVGTAAKRVALIRKAGPALRSTENDDDA